MILAYFYIIFSIVFGLAGYFFIFEKIASGFIFIGVSVFYLILYIFAITKNENKKEVYQKND